MQHPNSSINWQALLTAFSAKFISIPFSNLEDASVLRPNFLDVALIFL